MTWRSSTALVLAGAQLLATLPGVAVNASSCTDRSSAAPGPPYAGEPWVEVTVDNPHDQDVMVDYWAAPAGETDPWPAPPSWTRGCTDDAFAGICGPPEPLVFTSAAIDGYNAESSPGTYTLRAAVYQLCLYSDDAGLPDVSRQELVRDSVAEVHVTARIRDFRPDGTRRRPDHTLRATVPMRPDDDLTDYAAWWRELGTFEWDPASGVSDVRAARPADPSPVGSTIDFVLLIVALTSVVLPEVRDGPNIVTNVILNMIDFRNSRRDRAAQPASDDRSLVAEAEAGRQIAELLRIPATLGDLLRMVNPPSSMPNVEDSVWVRVDHPQQVDDDVWLETNDWYQLKIAADGSQVFFDSAGGYIGTQERSDGQGVAVHVWSGDGPDGDP